MHEGQEVYEKAGGSQGSQCAYRSLLHALQNYGTSRSLQDIHAWIQIRQSHLESSSLLPAPHTPALPTSLPLEHPIEVDPDSQEPDIKIWVARSEVTDSSETIAECVRGGFDAVADRVESIAIGLGSGLEGC